MGPGNNNTGNSNSKIQSFLEALRSSQARSNVNSQEKITNPFAEFQKKKEAEKKRSEAFFQARQQEWNKVYSSKEKETERRIESLKAELKSLAKQVKNLDQNLQKAVDSPVRAMGEYQVTFLEHIKKMIHLFSLKVQEANSWLETFNGRKSGKSYYWGMAKTKGNNFTQANERTVATSVG